MLVPLCALATWWHPAKPYRKLRGLVPFALLAVAYFALGYASRANHQHFHDGTFSLSAPVIETLVRSIGGLLWIWGFVSIPMLLTATARRWRNILPLAGLWMIITLLPYSFLTYMPRVPSRHTYLASVGLSLIVAAGLLAVNELTRGSKKAWLTPCLMAIILIHQCGYLWSFKYWQYYQRAQPTEHLIRVAEQNPGDIHANCFPYSPNIADYALRLKIGDASYPKLVVGQAAAQHPNAINFCNANADGVHY